MEGRGQREGSACSADQGARTQDSKVPERLPGGSTEGGWGVRGERWVGCEG